MQIVETALPSSPQKLTTCQRIHWARDLTCMTPLCCRYCQSCSKTSKMKCLFFFFFFGTPQFLFDRFQIPRLSKLHKSIQNVKGAQACPVSRLRSSKKAGWWNLRGSPFQGMMKRDWHEQQKRSTMMMSPFLKIYAIPCLYVFFYFYFDIFK